MPVTGSKGTVFFPDRKAFEKKRRAFFSFLWKLKKSEGKRLESRRNLSKDHPFARLFAKEDGKGRKWMRQKILIYSIVFLKKCGACGGFVRYWAYGDSLTLKWMRDGIQDRFNQEMSGVRGSHPIWTVRQEVLLRGVQESLA